MDGKLILLIIQLVKQALTIVYYSTAKMSYIDSVTFCENINGELLRYGQVFENGVRYCENTGNIGVWTGHPHYIKRGCTNNIGEKRSRDIIDIEFAKCADFCEIPKYTYVGISEQNCVCFSTQPVIDCTNDIKCPGNALEKCGQDDQAIVFEKVYNSTCRLRHYSNILGNSQPSLLNEVVCGSNSYSFFCKVGNDSDIDCENITTVTVFPGEITMSTQEPSTSATTEGNISTSITETPSVDLVTTREQNPQNETRNIGLIIGIAVAAAVLLTIIIVIICRRVRTKSTDSGETKHEKLVVYQKNVSQESDNDDTSVKPGGNQQSMMYDSASFGIKTANNGPDNTYSSTPNDVYDSAAQSKDRAKKNKQNNTEQEYGCVTKSEGVYDSAVQNQSETKQMTRKDDLHIYDYRGTTEGLYDSASNQQVVKKPHTEENEYGCTVKPEGLYDVSGTQSKVTSSLPADNIYDHNSDILYDISMNKSGNVVTDIYDHT